MSGDKLDNEVDAAFWHNLWDSNQAGWHEDKVDAGLIKFVDRLLLPGVEQHKVFVPLCGKTLDMKWLYDKGCRVVGVDIALNALEEFMVEHGIAYNRRKVGEAEVFESEDKRVALWCCNLFDFAKVCEERSFDAIWDRGSFVAINLSEREQYVDLMKSLLASDFRYLLQWLEYDNRLFGGPPKTSSPAEIERLFGKYFKVTTLLSETMEMSGLGELKELVDYFSLLSPK